MTDINYKFIILVDKPRGITSNKVLSRIKILIRNHLKCENKDLPKIGHGGTLDPEATGLLIVGLTRNGTKKLNDHINEDKIYECEIDLLKDSKTGDLESFVQMEIQDLKPPDLVTIQDVLISKFIGEIEQIPPAYSALKINGKKAYELARAGKEVHLSPRKITMHSINILEYHFPVLKLRVHCSKGTYIRSLGQDIGKELNLYGTLISLRRFKSGIYSIEDAIKLDKLIFDDLIQEKLNTFNND